MPVRYVVHVDGLLGEWSNLPTARLVTKEAARKVLSRRLWMWMRESGSRIRAGRLVIAQVEVEPARRGGEGAWDEMGRS